MPEEKVFSFPLLLFLLLAFLAILFTVTYMLTPQIHKGWITLVLDSLSRLIGVP